MLEMLDASYEFGSLKLPYICIVLGGEIDSPLAI